MAGALHPEGPAPLALDLIEVAVPRGGRAVVVSDLHLSNPPTDASRNCSSELMAVLDGWDGPGVLVIAGDGFELLAGPNPNIHLVLDAHPDFAATVNAFAAGADHRLQAGRVPGRVVDPLTVDAGLQATARSDDPRPARATLNAASR